MDCKTSLETLEKTIDALRNLNAEVPILVEGEKDVRSLRTLGFTGELLTVYCGKDIVSLCDTLAAAYDEIVVLTDWDRKGGQIARRIKENLQGRVRCHDHARLVFAEHTMVSDVESLPSFLRTMRKKVYGP
jgi:dTMP kinase